MSLRGHHYICVVKAIKRRVFRLQSHNAPLSTPLARIYTGFGNCTSGVTPHLITKTLYKAVTWMGANLGFLLPFEVFARSLCAAGAMALVVAKVDPNIMQILGCWRLDEMFRYLNLTAKRIMKKFANKLFHANYTLAPSQLVPSH